MRKIKFRGQRKKDGRWIYGAYIPNDCTYWTEPSIADMNHRFEIRPETLGEYTGFNDLEGTEIYEGDILQLDDTGDIEGFLIVNFGDNEGTMWGRENYGFFITFTNAKLNKINRQDFMYWFRKGVRVVGNVHDNHELSEQKSSIFEPCPFCGKTSSIEVVADSTDNQHAVCSFHKGGCGASTGYQRSYNEAVRVWNRRAK